MSDTINFVIKRDGFCTFAFEATDRYYSAFNCNRMFVDELLHNMELTASNIENNEDLTVTFSFSRPAEIELETNVPDGGFPF